MYALIDVHNDLYLARKKIKDTLNYKIYINEDLTQRRSNVLHSLKRDALTKSSWSYNGFICCTLKDNDHIILSIKSPYDLIKHYKYDINKLNSFSPFINVYYLLLHFKINNHV